MSIILIPKMGDELGICGASFLYPTGSWVKMCHPLRVLPVFHHPVLLKYCHPFRIVIKTDLIIVFNPERCRTDNSFANN
jgi:hypothetical protein